MPHTLTWHGHSNFQLRTADGKTVLIDPFFEGNPSAGTGAESIESVDAVFITHDHDDHMGQALEICQRTGATAVAMFDVCGKLKDLGLPQEQCLGMNIGGTVDAAGLKAKMVQAMHSSATGVAAGFILTLPDGFCLYHAGDTGLFSSMELFGKFHDIHLALLPIDGHFNMDPEQAAYAARLLGCRRTVAMHWGTFPILEQNTDRFQGQLERLAPRCGLVPMQPGESVTLTPPENAGEPCGCD
ncbi:metal-dependent hydrolase [Desulfohalovibrio reitneri]|uniref:metal-dependent hydrolase n=1 Tax=Desulfohalovibrio reitneri TaxID=1307759 RepID=UPI0004A6E6D6|nr:metal-dependent hydrolase [Desulfohalovibrio reitneri]